MTDKLRCAANLGDMRFIRDCDGDALYLMNHPAFGRAVCSKVALNNFLGEYAQIVDYREIQRDTNPLGDDAIIVYDCGFLESGAHIYWVTERVTDGWRVSQFTKHSFDTVIKPMLDECPSSIWYKLTHFIVPLM